MKLLYDRLYVGAKDECVTYKGGRPSKKISWEESIKGFSLAQKAKNFLKSQPGCRATPRQIQRRFKNGSEFLSVKDLQDLQPWLTFFGVVRILPKEKWQPAYYACIGDAFRQAIKNKKLGEDNESKSHFQKNPSG